MMYDFVIETREVQKATSGVIFVLFNLTVTKEIC